MQRIVTFFVMLLGVVFTTHLRAQVTASIQSPNPVPSSLCGGDTISFIADNTQGNITTFAWNFGGANAGPQSVFSQNAQLIGGVPGVYPCTLAVSDGTVFDTLFFMIRVDSCIPPTISISGAPTTICVGSTVFFTDATTPGSSAINSRLWTFPGGVPATSTIANPVVTYSSVGVYSVFYEIQDSLGTYKDTLSGYITVVNCPKPVADFTVNKQQICPGDCISFFDQSQNVIQGQSTWSWSFPGSDSAVSTKQNPTNICYPIPGKYDVVLTVTNSNGTHTETKTGFIVVDSCNAPTASYRVEKDKICQGTCVQFFNTSWGADSLVWNFQGANPFYQVSSESNPIVCYDDTGTFNVQLLAVNAYGADPLLVVDAISVKPFPVVQAPPDTSVLIGNSVRLVSYGDGRKFIWSPEDGVECPFCPSTMVSPERNTTYYVTNVNENGCSATDSVVVLVHHQYYRGVPDAFTPNGDGENDQLKLLGNGIMAIEFYVYDRHGNIVFETKDINEGWDGMYKDEPMQAGVYVYFVKITYLSGYQEILKGNVTLVR